MGAHDNIASSRGPRRAILLYAMSAWAGTTATFAISAPQVESTTAKTGSSAVELHTQNIRPGLDVVSGAGCNVVVWSGTDGVVLVDSGVATATASLVDAVAGVAPGDVRYLINTHAHVDHTGGNAAFVGKGAIVIGYENVREHVERDGDGDEDESADDDADSAATAIRPLLASRDGLTLDLNGDRLDAIHVADAHSSADIVVRWNDADVVAMGDIYWNAQYPYFDVEAAGSLAGTVAAVEAVLARATARTVIIPGHGPVSSRAELAAYRDMLVAVGRKVREAVEQGLGIEDVLATHPTADFDARFAGAGAVVSPDEFVRSVYRDLARKRPGR